MKNEFHAEQQAVKQVYTQPVLVNLGDLKRITLGDGPDTDSGDGVSNIP